MKKGPNPTLKKNHTLRLANVASCPNPKHLSGIVHPDDMALAVMICKSTQQQWIAASNMAEFTCVGCDKPCRVDDNYTNEVVFEREAVARCARDMLQPGKKVNGLSAILACYSFEQAMKTTGKPNVGFLRKRDSV